MERITGSFEVCGRYMHIFDFKIIVYTEHKDLANRIDAAKKLEDANHDRGAERTSQINRETYGSIGSKYEWFDLLDEGLGVIPPLRGEVEVLISRNQCSDF